MQITLFLFPFHHTYLSAEQEIPAVYGVGVEYFSTIAKKDKFHR